MTSLFKFKTKTINMEVVKDENINLLEYGYKKGELVEIPAEAIYQLMMFAKTVGDSEKRYGFMHSYPKSKPKLHKDKDGQLESVEIEWEDYPTAKSFFNQNFQIFHTELGASALDLETKMKSIHLENIKSGKAVRLGKFEPQKTQDEESAKFS